MRLGFAALALTLALPAAAQDRISAITVATGYATGFEAGAVHNELRLRVPVSPHVALEPMASWTRGFAFGQPDRCTTDAIGYCAFASTRSSGASALALGSALTVRTEAGLPLGLDAAHAGVFAQAVFPIWTSRGQRLGAEAGAEARLGRLISIGADVQAAYFTASDAGLDRISVTPLLRVAVGK